MIKLSDGNLRALLPPHIAEDPTLAAAAAVIEPHLRTLAQAVPNLLLFARLGGQQPDKMLPPLRRLASAAGGLQPATGPLLESLAWQFSVDFREAAKSEEQLAAMVRQSIPWHRIKGTPASIKAALELFGFHKVVIEEHCQGMHWASYQIGLDTVADLETVYLVARVAAEMAPVRCRLGRIYNAAYDLRPAVWGLGKWGHERYGSYSGVPVPDVPGTDDGFIVSFGRRTTMITPAVQPFMLLAGQRRFGLHVRYIDRPAWGRTKWGAHGMRLYPALLGKLRSFYWGDLVPVPQSWTGTWDDRPWILPGKAGRLLPQIGITPYSQSKAQAIWGRNGYGMENSRYGHPYIVEHAASTRWGVTPYGQSTGEKVRQALFFTSRHTAMLLPAMAPAAIPCQRSCARLLTLTGAPFDRDIWAVTPWGQTFAKKTPAVRCVHHALYFGSRAPSTRLWTGPWDVRPWLDIVPARRNPPAGGMVVRTVTL